MGLRLQADVLNQIVAQVFRGRAIVARCRFASPEEFFVKIVRPLVAFVKYDFRTQIVGLLEPNAGL